MADFIFKKINLSDAKEILKYEKGLYEAFHNDSWYLEHYIIIDNRRMQTKIEYSDQSVYIALKDGKLAGGSALNFNTEIKWQLEELGFKIDKKNKKICEGLTLYSTKEVKSNEFVKFLSFFDFILEDIKRQKVEKWYATCSKSMLLAHKMVGYEVIDQTIINGELEYLVKMDITY